MGTTRLRQYIITLILFLIGLNLSYLLAFYISFSGLWSERSAADGASYRVLLIVGNLLLIACYSVSERVRRNDRSLFLMFLVGYLFLIVFLQAYEFSRFFHLAFLCSFFLFLGFWRVTDAFRQLERVLMLGHETNFAALCTASDDDILKSYLKGLPGLNRLKAVFGQSENAGYYGEVFHGDPGQLGEFLQRERVDELIIQPSFLSSEHFPEIIGLAEEYHLNLTFLPPSLGFLPEQYFQTALWKGLPVIQVVHSKLAVLPYQILKRSFDILFSLIFLVIVFPFLFVIVAAVIRLGSHGPVFFRQLRKGYRQVPFSCYKFRTMDLGNEDQVTVQARPDDPRVNLVGKLLRRRSLDEIPQFINVLMGKMSIVGPRPHMVEHDEYYNRIIGRYNVRFAAKPGITGWAQINGLRGGTPDSELMERRIEFDLWYIKNWSFWLDLKIIIKTIILLLKKDLNAY